MSLVKILTLILLKGSLESMIDSPIKQIKFWRVFKKKHNLSETLQRIVRSANVTLNGNTSVTFNSSIPEVIPRNRVVDEENWTSNLIEVVLPMVLVFGSLLLASCYLFRMSGPVCRLLSEEPSIEEGQQSTES